MKNTIKLSYNHFMTPKTLAEAADDRDIIGIFSISKKDPSKLSVKEDIGDLMIISDNATTFKEMASTNREYKLLLWSYLDDYENYIYTMWLNGVKFANIVKHLGGIDGVQTDA